MKRKDDRTIEILWCGKWTEMPRRVVEELAANGRKIQTRAVREAKTQ